MISLFINVDGTWQNNICMLESDFVLTATQK